MVAEMTTAGGRTFYEVLSLQWGRDQLVAEMKQDQQIEYIHVSLQWGRDQLVAEIPVADPRNRGRTALLQWGRDQLVAEITIDSSIR